MTANFQGEPLTQRPCRQEDRTENLLDDAAIEALTNATERYAALMVLKGSTAGQLYRLQSMEAVVGRGEDCDIVLKDRGVSRQHCKFVTSPDGKVSVVDLGSTNGVFVGSERVHNRVLQEGDKVTIGGLVILRFSLHDALEEELQTQLYRSATRDGLTGAVNKQHFLERLHQSLSLARRHGTPLTLAMGDVDHFKSVNDTYGHAAGDAVLREVSRRIQTTLRGEDLLGRYGGEEFIVLMDQTALEGGRLVAERIRAAIEAAPFRVPAKDGWTNIRVTMSMGVSMLRPTDSEAELIMRADTALYASKNGGRNQVQVESPAL